MLAYARSIQVTEGLFFATQTMNDKTIRRPIEVLEKGVRGQSSYASEDRADKAGKSNPQSVEFAIVPLGYDGIELEFSLRIMPLSMKPHASDDIDVGATYQRLASAYKRAGGYYTLAALYAWNIANARFAWRNRYQSDQMSVRISFPEEICFDPSQLPLDRPANPTELQNAMTAGDPADFDKLVEKIALGLSETNPDHPFTAKVIWSAKMEPGQELFPSQEYLREEKEKSIKYKDVSRVLAKLPGFADGRKIGQASMHSQKIGAALRHIDIWHDSSSDGAIAVNPYGGVQETGAVLRKPKEKTNFYEIRKNASRLVEAVESARDAEGLSGDVHFFMANLVRGGVFGSGSK